MVYAPKHKIATLISLNEDWEFSDVESQVHLSRVSFCWFQSAQVVPLFIICR